MNIKEAFLRLFRGEKIALEVAGDEEPEDEIGIPLVSAALSKWSDTQFYGPGAEAARERRDRALGIEPQPPAVKQKAKRKKRKLDPLEALRRRRDQLKKEVEKNEG